MKAIFSVDEIENAAEALGIAKFCKPEKPQNIGKLCKKFKDLAKEMRAQGVDEVTIEGEHPFARPRVMPWLNL